MPYRESVDLMKEFMKKMEEMKAQSDREMEEMRRKTAELERKNAANEKKVRALAKDNEVMKGNSAANEKKLKVLAKDNEVLKKDNAALKVRAVAPGERRSVFEAVPHLMKVVEYKKVGESMEGNVEEFSLVITSLDFSVQLDHSREALTRLLKSHVDEPVKSTETLVLSMVKGLVSENTKEEIPITSETITLLNTGEVDASVVTSADRIKSNIEVYQDYLEWEGGVCLSCGELEAVLKFGHEVGKDSPGP